MINGVNLSSNITLTTANISASADKNYLTDAKLAVVNQTSGSNSGDETTGTIKTKLGITTLSGINTGDQDLSSLVTKTTMINGVNLSSNITLTTANISASADKNYLTDAKLAVVNQTSGSNSGDETTGTIKTKLGITTLSGINTGDQININGTAAGLSQVLNITSGGTGFTAKQILVVRDQKTTTTNGGASSAGSNTRTLNIEVVNTLTGASLAANQIMLPAGTYEISFLAPCFAGDKHRARLYNVTDSTAVLLGSTEVAPAAALVQSNSSARGIITIAGTKVFELRHNIQTASSFGLGIACADGQTEIYASVFIERIA
jgi:hypothetical protein